MSSRHDFRRKSAVLYETATVIAMTDRETLGGVGAHQGEANGTDGNTVRPLDYARDREDDSRRERDRRDDRRRDDRRDSGRDRDGRRDPPPRERESLRDGDRARDHVVKAGDRDGRTDDRRDPAVANASGSQATPVSRDIPDTRSRQPSEMPIEDGEEGEAMDATNEDDTAMMAMMGMSGFGTTKGKHVDGNQEGGVDVKKMRTWRQYMNRRGGFNRPLDKIK
ncbi:uncharacterized protein B0H18DRAFT_1119067 [Fomitopsis serialis]|uniref:uncharacterized protein n=1 Tax=Fomitopsis serialis TaxID=139415 RepID=UPI002008AB89|nr:uncharacterized protein B0H18DRAFT_1119067 [Neoantrodia serialis]KAH9926170.1 hypothetical protein B0H18DRAFT_1119067 [Neoantrodia serialis]